MSSILGWILPNLPFYTTVLAKLALGMRGLMMRHEFIPGIVKVWVTVDLVPVPELIMQLTAFTFQNTHLI